MGGHKGRRTIKPSGYCNQCGRPLFIRPRSRRRYFCSGDCRKAFRNGEPFGYIGGKEVMLVVPTI